MLPKYSILLLLIALHSLLCLQPVASADWGYDSRYATPPEKELKPNEGARSINQAPANQAPAPARKPKPATFSQPEQIDIDGKIRQKKEAAETSTRKRLDRQHELIDQWLGVFDLLSEQKLTAEQKARFTTKLIAWANSPDRANFESVSRFWPQVAKAIKTSPDQQQNYKDLLKALLRLQKRTGIANPQEDELVDELLGPERVAVPGTPPLTEDAVEAYADMTCFIYGQTHPGKTVDALDNRTVFVATIEHRFEDATSMPEKVAIANFALKWSKFRVLYASANDTDKDKLFKRLTGTSAEPQQTDINNTTLDAVLANGPWTAALNAKIAPAPAAQSSSGRAPNTLRAPRLESPESPESRSLDMPSKSDEKISEQKTGDSSTLK